GQAGVILNTVCGGGGICGKCVVTVNPPGEKVQACQYRIESDLTVTIEPAARFFEQKILTEGIESRGKIKPDIYNKYQRGDSSKQILGIAVDIGTTTVVAKLVDMATGVTVATESSVNPQCSCGDDVISRIHYAGDDNKLAELHRLIIDCVNEMTGRLCKAASVKPESIYEVSVVGNTTMNHIFLKLPVAGLGQAPYKAKSLDAYDISPSRLKLQMNAEGNVHTVENIAGFVGSDITAVALAVEIDSVEKNTLVVDIGTNGEILLACDGKLYAASCAAGPAMEGARISQGSRAVAGAIEAVVVNGGDIDIDVVGGAEPVSICGSGLIDAVAVLLELGVIDITGRFVDRRSLRKTLSAELFARLTEVDGQSGFILARGSSRVCLIQKDIRELQLAKAAIRAGVRLLQKKVGLADKDIEQIFLAGAFGNYIRRKSALRIGMLANVPLERIRFIGNAACSGAVLTLISDKARDTAGRLAERIEYVEIAHQKDFASVYADAMVLG
ncbi:MAG: ASKHA domain-containing protein, partial [Planctomycetota bacterium]